MTSPCTECEQGPCCTSTFPECVGGWPKVPIMPRERTPQPEAGRRFPMIDVEAVRRHMPPGFPPLDPEEMLSDVALAGVRLEPWGSAHFAASNRALWLRVAELEAELIDALEEHSCYHPDGDGPCPMCKRLAELNRPKG